MLNAVNTRHARSLETLVTKINHVHSQDIDYTMESSFQDVKDVQMALSKVKNKIIHICYIYASYIYIYSNKANEFYQSHTSIANLIKRIHNLS